MKTKVNAFLTFLVAVLLTSCGSGEECLLGDSCQPAPDPLPIDTSLDCENLDPDKVYLHGTLQEGLAGRDALVDPLNPTSFCVGFGDATVEGIITTGGRYIFEEDLSIYRLEQDEVGTVLSNPDEPVWVYPNNALDNDTLLHTSTAPSCGVRLIMVNPSNNDLFYSCPNNTIHTETTSPYYLLGNDDLLAITADGSMVIGSFSGVRVVTDSMSETALTVPAAVGFSTLQFLTAKHYVDPNTNNDSLWIALEGFNDGSIRRWSVDLVTSIVTDQGPFADLPVDTSGSFSYRMDGDGNLWQTGSDSTAVFVDVIIQRPIGSGGELSTIVYSEANLTTTDNWTREDLPEVRMHGSRLVTGP